LKLETLVGLQAGAHSLRIRRLEDPGTARIDACLESSYYTTEIFTWLLILLVIISAKERSPVLPDMLSSQIFCTFKKGIDSVKDGINQ
jgi:hypothetical protein